VGWGPMSDQSVLDQMSVSQGSRWYSYRPVKREFPLPLDTIVSHSANMHLMPSSGQIESGLKQVRVGDLVELKGYLVQVTGTNGFQWRSSLSRTDRGGGACELMWVESVSTAW